MDNVASKAETPFQRSEFISRLQAVRKSMTTRGIELLLLSDPCNIYYLTGYDGWSFYTPQFLLVTLDHEPVWIGRHMDSLGVRMLAWIGADSVVSYPDNLVQSSSGHPVGVVADYIRREHGAVRRVGVEKNSYYLTVDSYELLIQALGNITVLDASLLVNWIRFVKSPEEIRVLKQAARLLDLSMAAAIDIAEPGVRECDVAAAVYAANHKGTTSFGGVYTSSPAFVSCADRAAAPHLCWTDREIEPSTSMHLELMGNRHRYQVTMARTIHFGNAPRNLKKLEDVVLEGIDRVLDFIKPGVTCEEVEAIWQKSIAKYGLSKESRCGYSLGITYPPTGGELTASFRPGDRTELRTNVVMHFLPAIWSTVQSLTISEPVLVTEDGCECLSHVPRKLIIKKQRPASGRVRSVNT